MSSKPVALILGSGPRVGTAVAKKLASQGYNIAIVSRKGSDTKTSEGFLSLKADFAEPNSIPALFDKVKAEFHSFPNVVVYNAAAMSPPPVQDNIFSNTAENLAKDLNVNTISAYVAAQQAIRGWETLPKEINKTFIFTGNITNVAIMPMAATWTLGVGKSASSYWIGLADMKHSAQGYR
jgi:NAD(P)-dependent dehydrogenase (short-subunit alcohol dehydrogenase family)